jgi:beta-phosphoglucomutase-like phosphatase (HAD superfamily)
MGICLSQTTKCGDEVENGKPAPDSFLATAQKMGVAPEQCLVIEDAPTGVQAATAAGMRVVVVPSLRDLDAYPKPDSACTSGIPLSESPFFTEMHPVL